MERLQKALARAGFGSRRACEHLIVEGRVTINGTVATLGDRIDPTADVVAVGGVEVNLDPSVRYYAVHKPAGVVTSMRDEAGRQDLRSLLPPDAPRVFPVGRLDRDSEGLLLMTNDGDLAHRLMHPRFGVEKVYLVEVEGRPSARHLARLRAGVELDDGPARPSSVRLVDARPDRGQLEVTMREGRKREVRRMLSAVGLPVVRLVRVRIGAVSLGAMPPGSVRELEADEVVALTREVAKAERRAAGTPPPAG